MIGSYKSRLCRCCTGRTPRFTPTFPHYGIPIQDHKCIPHVNKTQVLLLDYDSLFNLAFSKATFFLPFFFLRVVQQMILYV